jgi:hypothetical protein
MSANDQATAAGDLTPDDIDLIRAVGLTAICPHKGCLPIKVRFNASCMRRHFHDTHYPGYTGPSTNLRTFIGTYIANIGDMDPSRCFATAPTPAPAKDTPVSKLAVKQPVVLEAASVKAKFDVPPIYVGGREVFLGYLATTEKIQVVRYAGLASRSRFLTETVHGSLLLYDSVVSATMEAAACPFLDNVSVAKAGLNVAAPRNTYSIRRAASATLTDLRGVEGLAELTIAVGSVLGAIEHANQRGMVLGGVMPDMICRSNAEGEGWFVRSTPLAAAVPSLIPQYINGLSATPAKGMMNPELVWFLEKHYIPPVDSIEWGKWRPTDDLYTLGVTIGTMLQGLLLERKDWCIFEHTAGENMVPAILLLRARVESAVETSVCLTAASRLAQIAIRLVSNTISVPEAVAAFKVSGTVVIGWPGCEAIHTPIHMDDSVMILIHRFTNLAWRRMGKIDPTTIILKLGARTLGLGEVLRTIEKELDESSWRLAGVLGGFKEVLAPAAPSPFPQLGPGQITIQYDFVRDAGATLYEVICRVALHLLHVKNPLAICLLRRGDPSGDEPLRQKDLHGAGPLSIGVRLRRPPEDEPIGMDAFHLERLPVLMKPVILFRGSVTMSDGVGTPCLLSPSLSKTLAISGYALTLSRLKPLPNLVQPVGIVGAGGDSVGVCYMPSFYPENAATLRPDSLIRTMGTLASAVSHFHYCGIIHGSIESCVTLGREYTDQAELTPYVIINPASLTSLPEKSYERGQAMVKDLEGFATTAQELMARVTPALSRDAKTAFTDLVKSVKDGKLGLHQIGDALGFAMGYQVASANPAPRMSCPQDLARGPTDR